jgi:hypothetical protein
VSIFRAARTKLRIQNEDAMSNRIPQTNHRKRKSGEIAALACPTQKRDKCPNACDAKHWIEAEAQLRDTRLEKLNNKAIEENEQRNIDRFWTMRAISQG